MKKLLFAITLLSTLNIIFVVYTTIQCNNIIENQQKNSKNLQKEIEKSTIYLNKYFKY